jgi:hypothetical protein
MRIFPTPKDFRGDWGEVCSDPHSRETSESCRSGSGCAPSNGEGDCVGSLGQELRLVTVRVPHDFRVALPPPRIPRCTLAGGTLRNFFRKVWHPLFPEKMTGGNPGKLVAQGQRRFSLYTIWGTLRIMVLKVSWGTLGIMVPKVSGNNFRPGGTLRHMWRKVYSPRK